MLNGQIGSGKTTLTSKLIDWLPNSMELAFATELKRIANSLYDIPNELLYGSQANKLKPTKFKKSDGSFYNVREFICQLSDNMKLLDLWCFCRPVANYINSCYPEPNAVGSHRSLENFIVSDLRYPFEYYYLLYHCKCVEIKTLRLLSGDSMNSQHSSETSVQDFKFDLTVDNRNTSPEETFAEVKSLTREWFEKDNLTTTFI